MAALTFEGFPPRSLTLLAELAVNNNKTWFDAHKGEYESSLKEPALAFGEEMAERLSGIAPGPPLRASLFRIYRDLRFSKDKTPYKTHAGIPFTAGERSKGESPGFYFHLEAHQLMLGGGLHAFPKRVLEAYRKAVAGEELGPRLAQIMEALRKDGYDVWGETYKRVPRGYDPDHPRAKLLRHSGLFAGVTLAPPSELHSPELLDLSFGYYRPLVPLLEWLRHLDSAP